jgi:ADP-ribose pyrophosphatase
MPANLINRETVYRGKILSIEAVLLDFPDGRRASYDLVRHNPSVTILPVDAEGLVYLVRQYRLGADRDLLELPAGVVENDEDPQACAIRELREEIGMSSEELTLMGQAYLIPGYGDELMYFYLARGLKSDPLEADPDEFIRIERFTISELYLLVNSGDIYDSKTLAALMLARRFLFSPEAV